MRIESLTRGNETDNFIMIECLFEIKGLFSTEYKRHDLIVRKKSFFVCFAPTGKMLTSDLWDTIRHFIESNSKYKEYK